MTYPLTSQTQQPGYEPNIAGTYSGQPGTNAYWKQTLAEWMSSMWAQGGDSRQQLLSIMSPVWYSARYGEPDGTDADGLYSPRTLLSFSRFASSYQPGSSPAIDQIMPYVPPGPNDFIETPEQTATRIANAQFEKDLDARIAMNMADIQARAAEGAANRAFTGAENAADRALKAQEINAQIAAEMESIKASMKQAGMAAFNNAFQNEISKFNVEAGMYNTQQGIQSANLQQAGSLASIFQQVLDERTGKAIEAQVNPGDWLRREAEVRAQTAPQGTETPAYKDYDVLQEIIQMLKNTPGGIKPITPDQNSFVPPQFLQDLINYTPTTPAQVTAPAAAYTGGGTGGGTSAADAIAALLKAGYGDSSQRTPTGQPAMVSGSPGAGGITSATNPTYGPDYYSGVPNSQVADLITAGMRKLVTTGIAGPSQASSYTGFNVYDPNRNMYKYNPTESIPAGSPIWLEKLAYGAMNHEVTEPVIIGDPQRNGKPNPEAVEIVNPGPRTRINVTPLQGVAKKHLRGAKKFAYGTDLFDPETLKLKSYPDEAYRDYSSLQYLQGRQNDKQYNRLSTGSATGYGGGQYPESGAINYGKYLKLAQDPVSLAMVASGYRSASRDLFAEVARAKARAPFGQAVSTSLIRS